MGETQQMADLADSARREREAREKAQQSIRNSVERIRAQAQAVASEAPRLHRSQGRMSQTLPVTEQSWLQNALQITTSERRRDYGHPLPNFLRIAMRYSITLERGVSPLDVEHLSIDLKMARDQNHFKDDNWVDTIGYANTVQMIDERMKELNYPDGIATFKKYKDGDLMKFMFDLLLIHEREYPNGS